MQLFFFNLFFFRQKQNETGLFQTIQNISHTLKILTSGTVLSLMLNISGSICARALLLMTDVKITRGVSGNLNVVKPGKIRWI